MILKLSDIQKSIENSKDWQERVLNIDIYHCEKIRLEGDKWSIRKTAKALNMCASTVCEDLMIYKEVCRNQKLESFKRRKDVLSYIRRRR